MSPKSFLRKPTRKRNRKSRLPLFGILGGVVLLGLCVGTVFSLHGATLVSPLPGKIGIQLPVTASEPEDKELMRLLGAHQIRYSAIERTHDAYVITVSPKYQVVLSKKKDLSEQISSLQVLLPRLTMEEREFHRLDLRFDKPVVTY